MEGQILHALDKVLPGQTGSVLVLAHNDVTVSPLLQVRMLPPGPGKLILRDATVDEYAEIISEHGHMGELIVVQTANGTRLLADGFHRKEAYKRLHRDTFPVLLFEGTQTQALLVACLANAGRGLQYGHADKRKVTEQYIKALLDQIDAYKAELQAAGTTITDELERTDPRLQLPSLRQIARDLSVSHTTAVRALEAINEIYAVPRYRTVERDQATYSLLTPKITSEYEGAGVLDRFDAMAFEPVEDAEVRPSTRGNSHQRVSIRARAPEPPPIDAPRPTTLHEPKRAGWQMVTQTPPTGDLHEVNVLISWSARDGNQVFQGNENLHTLEALPLEVQDTLLGELASLAARRQTA